MSEVLEIPIPLSVYSRYVAELRIGTLVSFTHHFSKNGISGVSFDLPFKIMGIRQAGRDIVLIVKKEPTDFIDENNGLKN